MRIQHGVRAALAVLVLVGVVAAGCKSDTQSKSTDVYVSGPSSTPSSKPSSTSKAKSPVLMFEGVAATGTKDTAGAVTFTLTGYVRNIGDATGTLGVQVMASDNGIAIISESKATLEVPILVPGLASKFTMEVKTTNHNSVLFLYWGTVNGASLATPYSASYTIPATAPPTTPVNTTPAAGDIVFENVTAPLDTAVSPKFHLNGTIKNKGIATVAGMV